MSPANMSYGLPSSQQMFGNIGDPAQNGVQPGGVHADLTTPDTPGDVAGASRLDKGGLVHPKTSPTFWVAAIAIVFVYLNYRARR